MPRMTLAKLKAFNASLRANRERMKPYTDALHAAEASGDRDAWFAAINAARTNDLPPMPPLTREAFETFADSRKPR